MALSELTKQPQESRLYNFDFANLLLDGATLAGVVSVTQARAGQVAGSADCSLGPAVLASPVVQVRIGDGTDRERYKLTALATDSAGNRLECEGWLNVREI